MTEKREIPDKSNRTQMLEEFEFDPSTGLAPFEDECAILLDEFSGGSPTMLDEFERSSEVIYIDEILGSDQEDNEQEEREGEPEHIEEIDEPEGESDNQVDEDDTDKLKALEDERLVDDEPPSEEEYEPPEPVGIPAPAKPVIGFICEHALDIADLVDEYGRMIERPGVILVSVPCAGMVKPSWLRLALDRGASGAFIVSCTEGSCHHRRGAAIMEERWKGSRRPMLLSKCDRRRLKLFNHYKAAGKAILSDIDEFLVELGKLDAGESG